MFVCRYPSLSTFATRVLPWVCAYLPRLVFGVFRLVKLAMCVMGPTCCLVHIGAGTKHGDLVSFCNFLFAKPPMLRRSVDYITQWDTEKCAMSTMKTLFAVVSRERIGGDFEFFESAVVCAVLVASLLQLPKTM